MRIAIGGLLHETATFIDGRTTLGDFERGFGLFRGGEVLERMRGANMCPGGFLAGAEENGYDAVPLLWGFAYPSGLIERAAYDKLKGELLDRFREAEQTGGRIDGLLLDLHGSMVVDGIDDADGDIIAAFRELLGSRPIIVTTDLHSNHSKQRVAAANAIIGYRTYPHVDQFERGRDAGRMMARTVREEIQPGMALRQLPLFWNVAPQVTAHPPMDEVIRHLQEIERRPGMLSMTIATGFPWADVPDMGASVIAVADEDEWGVAQRAADELGDWIWSNRARWIVPRLPVRDALAAGEKTGKYPIFVADHADNTGGGAPGDSTEILQTFRDLKLRDALLLYLVDLEVVAKAHAAGVGGRFKSLLGGKSSPVQGPPLEVDAEVVALTEGAFAYDGPMFKGLQGNMGKSAWIRFDDGINVVVVTAREQPLDPAFARTLGIDVSRMKYVAVKSAAHFRSGFEKLAGSIYNVDARAILTHDFTQLPYKKRLRRFFPVELS